jgi:3-hydroxyacyl-CoA dehydrogenase/enoyl-CoA hydratase/3-hydroxybutyryl-CoA epimerase
VVNDSRGFYTSRVIGTMVNEGLAMLAEGVHPVSLERATTQDGYPVGVLQLSDELNMELFKKISTATRNAVEAAGGSYAEHPAEKVIDTMIDLGRPSRLKGAGFYEYDESGKRLGLWKGLADTFPSNLEAVPFRDVKDRLLFVEALETAKCFEEGVLESAAAANIGSIMGIGFPPNTGGAAQFMTGYQDPEDNEAPIGLAAFVARADELAEKYGDRFRPTAYLRSMAQKGESFPA